jgi:hypothetical protein
MTTTNTTLRDETSKPEPARSEPDDGDLAPTRRLELIADLFIHGVARALLAEDMNAPKDDATPEVARDGGEAP